MGTYDLPNHPPDASTEDSSDRTLTNGAPAGATGGQIGPYRLLQVLGQGGMGEVWLAEQKTPIQRTVALKLIKAGMDTKAVVARFESEQQALALMDHPNIARVFDAGSNAGGHPYFVMEYVPGLPITEYCDKHRLTDERATGIVYAGLRRRAARASESDHSPRFEAVERAGGGAGQQARCPKSSILDWRKPRGSA